MSDLTDAVKSNQKRESLIALRDKIAETISTTESGRDIAALSKRLIEVMDAIESMPDQNSKSTSVFAKARREVTRKNG